jgi:NitT/TauT family transport system ATP-binding protein
MNIEPGEFCVIVGPSGCGKSTLLNCIAGFDHPTSGSIEMDGKLIASRDRVPTPGPDRVVVFQHGALLPWRTVMWNACCGPVLQGKMSQQDAERRAAQMLANVGLQGFSSEYPARLSGGQKRRVEIVRALMCEPSLLLFDEPFRALDALTKSVVQEYLTVLLHENPKSCFFITHDLEEAIFLGDRVIVMTTRPGVIKAELKIDLPRPRSWSILTDKRFVEYERQLSAAVHEEARKAFAAGERELA